MLIKNNRASLVYLGKDIRLMPGINEIDAAAWQKLLKQPVLIAMVDANLLEEVSKESGVKALPEKQAAKAVEATYDVPLLDKWAATESREKVIKQIAKQKKALLPTDDQKRRSNEERGPVSEE